MAENSAKNLPSSGARQPGRGRQSLLQQTGYGGLEILRVCSRLAGWFYADSRYSLLKAADEKIALSVVYVNNKPLHLVFCSHSRHLFSKQRGFAVESAKGLAECGVWRGSCHKIGAEARRGQEPGHKNESMPRSGWGQDAETVQFRGWAVRTVEIRGLQRANGCLWHRAWDSEKPPADLAGPKMIGLTRSCSIAGYPTAKPAMTFSLLSNALSSRTQ
jgi:hypothetical protein